MFYLDNTNSNTYIYFTLSLSYPKIFSQQRSLTSEISQ